MSLDFLAFHTLFRSAAFLLLTFFNIASSSSFVICPSFMSSWPLLICWIGFLVISGGFPSKFLKCSFHFMDGCFSVAVLFLPLTSFTVCHTNGDYSSSTDFLILLVLALNVFLLFFLV